MLVVRPVQHADVEQCISIRLATLGSLVIGRPPPYPGYAEESEAAVHNDLDGKSHVKHLKVVDPEDESEVLAYAKWEIYPNGRPDLDKLAKPMDPADKLVDEYGDLREAAHEYFCKRNGHMGKYPHILLALLVTSPEHRRRGAGSLLLQWGIDESEKSGLQAYTQASEDGRRLYSHHGFKELETVDFQLQNYGLIGVERMTEMLRLPSSHAGEEAESQPAEGRWTIASIAIGFLESTFARLSKFMVRG